MNRNIESPEQLEAVLSNLKYSGDFSVENKNFAYQCIQKAQTFNDVELEFEARFVFITNATFLNQEAEALAMFPWLLKKCDEEPGRFDYFMTLWAYKWMIDELPHRAAIPMPQIKELQKDFVRRYRAYGTGEKVIHYTLCKFYLNTGELEKAKEEYLSYLLEYPLPA